MMLSKDSSKVKYQAVNMPPEIELKWISFNEALCVPTTCIDGRTAGFRLSVPGGSLGSLMTVLSSIDSSEILLDQNLISKIFSHVLSFQELYYHTDDHGASLPEASLYLSKPSDLDGFFSKELCASQLGCGHIKKTVEFESVYQISSKVVQALIKEFFLNLWNDKIDNISFDLLKGAHKEKAIVIVDSSMSVDELTEIPLILASEDNPIFVYHRFWHNYQLEKMTKLAYEALSLSLDEQKIQTILNLGQKGVLETVKQLAPHLPIKIIHLKGTEGFEVSSL